ncbi:MAG: DNA primase [Verrucomicrobiota bacterium]
MGYSKEQIEQVKQAVDIIDVIGDIIPLKRRGAYYWALSPFKKEKTPSFSVHPQRQFFKCYASGQSGDVFGFLMAYENLEFPEAVRRLAERAGIRLKEEYNPADREQEQKKDRLLSVHDHIQRYWSETLLKHPAAESARHYLRSRAIPLEWVEKYGLGYAPDTWDDCLRWAQNRNYHSDLMIEAGLAVQNEQGRVYDRFRGRLLFPIRNDSGRTIAFSGRILDSEAKTAKYVNSPETPLFTKSRVLYGLDKAKRPILDADCAIICEGQIDVLRCHDHGVTNVIAPLGTSFTQEHCRAIRRLTANVILCLDSDSAGQNAAERTARIFLNPTASDNKATASPSLGTSDLGLRIALVPEGHDPDSIIQSQGADFFRKEILDRSAEFIDFFVDLQKTKHDVATIAGRRTVIEETAKLLHELPNTTLREQNLSRAAYRLNISPDTLKAECHRLKQKKNFQPKYEKTSESFEQEVHHIVFTPEPAIGELIEFVLGREQLIPELQRIVHPDWLMDLAGGDILLKIIEMNAHDSWEGPESLVEQLSPGQQTFISSLQLNRLDALDLDDDHCKNHLIHACRKIHLRYINSRLKLISEALKHTGSSDEEQNSLLEEQIELSRKQRELLKLV